MSKKFVPKPQEYLSYYDKLLGINAEKIKFPLLSKFYLEIRNTFELTLRKEYSHLFDQMAEILDLDAQLQMLAHLIQDESSIHHLSEAEVIDMIKKDKQYYYREVSGYRMNRPAPWGLMYLSELFDQRNN